MPLRPKFMRAEKLVLIEGDGEVIADDIVQCLRFIDSQGAHRFRKLIDARRVTNEISQAIGDGLVSLARSRETLGAGGALAVVVGPNPTVRTLAERASQGAPQGRPFRVFDDFDEARRWIDLHRPAE